MFNSSGADTEHRAEMWGEGKERMKRCKEGRQRRSLGSRLSGMWRNSAAEIAIEMSSWEAELTWSTREGLSVVRLSKTLMSPDIESERISSPSVHAPPTC